MANPKNRDLRGQPLPKNHASADADNNFGRGAPDDRNERIEQMQRDDARSVQDSPQYRRREAHDVDREDCDIQREGIADEKPGVRLSKEELDKKNRG